MDVDQRGLKLIEIDRNPLKSLQNAPKEYEQIWPPLFPFIHSNSLTILTCTHT